jgi:hypothetical protein
MWYQGLENNPRFQSIRQIVTKTEGPLENSGVEEITDAKASDEEQASPITDEEYLGSSRFWRHYIYHSSEALTDGDRLKEIKRERPKKSDGSFHDFRYHILFRINNITGTVIMLSETTNIVDDLVQRVINPVLSPQLKPVQLNIDGLANHVMFKDPDEYELTLLRCWIAASGTNLDKISFEGDDLASAAIVRDNFKSFRPYFLGLSKRPENREILRLSQRGYIRMNYDRKELSTESRVIKKIGDFDVVVTSSDEDIGKAEACLVYISKNGFYL